MCYLRHLGLTGERLPRGRGVWDLLQLRKEEDLTSKVAGRGGSHVHEGLSTIIEGPILRGVFVILLIRGAESEEESN